MIKGIILGHIINLKGSYMNYRETMFIMSAQRANDLNNESNHEALKKYLDFERVPFKEVIGMYKGEFEKSVVIIGLKYESDVQAYASMFKQESYLMVHNDRAAELKFINDDGQVGETIMLGKFIPKPDSVSLDSLDSWTQDISSGSFFITVKE